MGASDNLSSELETLKQEVAELKEYKRQKELEKLEDSNSLEESTDEAGSETSSVDSEASENAGHNIADQLETFYHNVGEIELEHPALTLVAVFTLGAVVGHLLSRR